MEDFTFPSIPPEQWGAKTLSFSYFASPPPWFIVPGAGDTEAGHDHHRRCFSAVDHARNSSSSRDYPGGRSERFAAVEEHRMDMLWEDFNEELTRAAPPCPLSKEWASEDDWLPGDGTLSRHVAAASGGSVVRRRRLSLLMMLKLLKKLFLRSRSSSSTSKKTPPI